MNQLSTASAQKELRSFVSRIENLENEIKERNSDKSDIYAEAKSKGFDVRALKAVVAYRRKDANEQHEFEAIFDTYMHALGIGTNYATRARAGSAKSDNPDTAEGESSPPPTSARASTVRAAAPRDDSPLHSKTVADPQPPHPIGDSAAPPTSSPDGGATSIHDDLDIRKQPWARSYQRAS